MKHGKIGGWIPSALLLGAAFFCSVPPASAEDDGSIPAAETANAPAQEEQRVYYEPEGSYFLG